MRRRDWLRFDLRPLGHPVWWTALALLACNDHLLKGRGFLPGWLTGKLSDFAFLVVTPVLAAALCPRALPGRRSIALATVCALFSAAKLSAAVSDALVAALGHLGVAWRLWPDPTDLLALTAVPLSAWLMRHRPDGAWPRWQRVRERLAIATGAMACLATSAPLSHPHQPFLLNAAPDTATVSITWLLRTVPCRQESDEPPGSAVVSNDAAAALADTLTPGDLDDPLTVTLARGQVAALDGEPAAGISPVGVCATDKASPLGICVGAVLQSGTAAPVLVIGPAHWSESDGGAFFSCQNPPSPVSRCKPTMDPSRDGGPDAVTLKMVNGILTFVAGAKLGIAQLDLNALATRTSVPDSCRALKQQYESLLEPQSCSSNTDCVAIPDLPIPHAPTPCGVNVNTAGALALSRLGTQWNASCVRAPLNDCTAAQPAVCRAGVCGPVCPGESIPACPAPCYAGNGTPGASCDGYENPCTGPGGLVCHCKNATILCQSAQPVSATCPMICNDPPGGGTYSNGIVFHPSLDAGAPLDAAAADGGTIDRGEADRATDVRADLGNASASAGDM